MGVFCPDTDLGFMGGQFWYDGVICDTGQRTQMGDSRSHILGSCPDCKDPINPLGIGTSSPGAGGTKVFASTKSKLERRVFRKGVPCPHNPFLDPDEFCIAGPPVKVIADFTVEYEDKHKNHPKKYLARLLKIAIADNPPTAPHRVIGIGIELDPASPPSPDNVLNISSSSTTLMEKINAVHFLKIDQYPEMLFQVVTMG
jgi:hypothetical protein